MDVILGQTDATGNKCNRRPTSGRGIGLRRLLARRLPICFASRARFLSTELGNLFVSDHSLELAGQLAALGIPAPLDPCRQCYCHPCPCRH